MPTLLLSYWKPFAILVALLSVFYAGYHTRGAFDQVTADKLLQAQIEANQKAQDILNAKSAKVEADLATERVKSSDLTKRWGKIYGQKHTVCMLSANTQQLLYDASTGENNNPR